MLRPAGHKLGTLWAVVNKAERISSYTATGRKEWISCTFGMPLTPALANTSWSQPSSSLAFVLREVKILIYDTSLTQKVLLKFYLLIWSYSAKAVRAKWVLFDH